MNTPYRTNEYRPSSQCDLCNQHVSRLFNVSGYSTTVDICETCYDVDSKPTRMSIPNGVWHREIMFTSAGHTVLKWVELLP